MYTFLIIKESIPLQEVLGICFETIQPQGEWK